MTKTEKKERVDEIKEMAQAFCQEHLNDELTGFALKLCDTLGSNRTLDITRGKKEVWAASIIYVISRLNFLFDKENDFFISADIICSFFGTKKTTVGNKATLIEKACGLGLGAEGYCGSKISDMLTLVELPNGMIIPKSMLPELEIVIEGADEEESEEIEQYMAEQQLLREQEKEAKKQRRAEINREIAAKKKKKKNEKQLSLFDNS